MRGLDLFMLMHHVRAEIPELIQARVSPSYLIHHHCMGTTKPSKRLRETIYINYAQLKFLFFFSSDSLAIARIFGGIPRSFFEEYHKHMPKTEPEDQYELRGDLYELFHYLNHTVLFGVS
jgi:fructosamine kinase